MACLIVCCVKIAFTHYWARKIIPPLAVSTGLSFSLHGTCLLQHWFLPENLNKKVYTGIMINEDKDVLIGLDFRNNVLH